MKIKRLSSRALHHHFIFIGFRKGTYGLSLFVYVSERMSPCFNFLSFIFAYMLSSLWHSFVLSECFVCPMRASNAVYLCNMSTLQTHRKKKKVEKTTTPTITTAATTRQRHNTTNCDIFDKGTCSPMNFDMSQCAIRFINTNDINDTAYASQISLATMVLIEFYATTKG